MDVDCDYLTIGGVDAEPDGLIDSCPHCSSARSLRRALVYQPAHQESDGVPASISVRPVTFEEASSGSMVPYVLSHETRDGRGIDPEDGDKTAHYYTVRNCLASIRGSVHLRDAAEYGTWLSEVDQCAAALGRLRSAAHVCSHLPDLKRFVLEQKNDDGLLHLASKWLRRGEHATVGIEMFGPFFVDVAFAPVFHKILRSDWLVMRKRNCGTCNELKPGWAQEFYDAREVPRSPDSEMRFVGHPTCPCCKPGEAKDLGVVARAIVREMRLCGYTPWSAVQAVRRCESSMLELSCSECRRVIFTHCAFLMECAAVEASRERDWLVRNEAVIQLCWVVHSLLPLEKQAAFPATDLSGACCVSENFAESEDGGGGEGEIPRRGEEGGNGEGKEDLPACETRQHGGAAAMYAWAFSVAAHCVAFQTYERNGSLDLEKIVVLYANDHLPMLLDDQDARGQGILTTSVSPDPRLFETAALNTGFVSPGLDPRDRLEERDMRVPPAGEVLYELPAPRTFRRSGSGTPVALAEIPSHTEARAQDPEAIAAAIALHFPKVSPCALDRLSLKVPRPSSLRADASLFWPVFVNPTRSCHKLFKALALPASPSPAYALETLARGWRRVKDLVRPDSPLPTASGGWVAVEREHYERYFEGPLDLLTRAGLTSESEKEAMQEALARGVLPCFAAEGESLPDALVNSTLALSFAASGLRLSAPRHLGGVERGRRGVEADGRSAVRVTVAGLLYFAAWYVLVYGNALHSRPSALEVLARNPGGTDADRHLRAAMELKIDRRATTGDWGEDDVGPDPSCRYSVHGYNDRSIVRAMLIVFEGLLDARTVLRAAQLYVPELTAQLPFFMALNVVPCTVKSAIEARDSWFAARLGNAESSPNDPPYAYLGDIAHGIRSSMRGALDRGDERPVAAPPASLDARASDPWHGCLLSLSESDDDWGSILSCATRDLESMSVQSDPDCWENEVEPGNQYVDSTARHPGTADGTERVATCSESAPRDPPVASGDQDVPSAALAQRDCPRSTLETLLVVDSPDSLGFAHQKVFPSETADANEWPGFVGVSSVPSLRKPCLTNVWNTTFAKTRRDAVPSSEPAVCSSASRPCKTLAEALWLMFVGAYGRRESDSAALTVEALAVVVHLASKIIDRNSTSGLGPCKDIKALCGDLYAAPEQFLPVVSIAAGLFGRNVTVCSQGTFFHICNSHHGNSWVQGFLECDGSSWQLRGLPPHTTPIELLFESGPNHRAGSLRAYARLHDLDVIEVPSDGYCGFHSVAQLLFNDTARGETRASLVTRTAEFVFLNAERADVRETYLTVNGPKNVSELKRLLSEEKRWLSVQEVKYMLEAHGKRLGLLTETSYPIYDRACAHIVWTRNHYEPLKPKVLRC
uniref:OTU domain-containing protein n=1 Tax=Oryzias latipes TaxID=8090 RepID=A0A286P9X9_ORYLA|nr:hypothetical protein [Oryzias latipes]